MYKRIHIHYYRRELCNSINFPKFYFVTWVNNRRSEFVSYQDAYRSQIRCGFRRFVIVCYLPQTLKDIKVYTEYWQFYDTQFSLSL